MIITHSIEMDLCRPGRVPRVAAVQDDRYSRNLAIALYSDGVPWDPGSGVMAIISYAKPDGTGGSYNLLPDGMRAWQIENNVVTVALAPQVCTAAGRVKLAVHLIRDQVQLSTFALELDVCGSPGLRITSEDYYRITGMVPDSGWLPDMLLGTDGSGRVTEVERLLLDDTLTRPGQAADAKTVGDRLGDLTALETTDQSSLVAAVNESAEMAQGSVKTINGVGPDSAGNVSMTIDAMPRPVGTAQVGQFLRVRQVDDNGKVLSVDTADITAAAPEETTSWHNMQDFSGSYANGNGNAVSYGVGEFPLDRTFTETVPADDTLICSTSMYTGVTNVFAGDKLELEVLFPEVTFDGADGGCTRHSFSLYTGAFGKHYGIAFNNNGNGTLTGDDDSTFFSSCTLQEKKDESGQIIGFSLSGIPAYDVTYFLFSNMTKEFTNEPPLTYTARVQYGSYDDIRYRVNAEDEVTEEPETTGPVVLNLCEFGIDLWELVTMGAGIHLIALDNEVIAAGFASMLPGPGQELLLVNDNGVRYPLTINNVVMAHQRDGTPIQVAFTATTLYNGNLFTVNVAIADNQGNWILVCKTAVEAALT